MNINDNYKPLVVLHTSFSKQPHLVRGCNHGLSASTFTAHALDHFHQPQLCPTKYVILRGCKIIFRNP